ncbi:MAG: hypothetical protein KDD61_14450, partial [Bdellovibrionales bacterium]|nr:hypothetical protein [Bdellovibrionales bacterium]
GMGNAYVSVVRDSDSLFYNPAGLGLNSGYYWTVADPLVGLNGEEAIASLQNFQDPSNFASALSNLSGQKLWAGGGAKTALRTPWFALAYYNNFDASMAIDDPNSPILELNFINDVGYALGFGGQLLPLMYFGLGVRHITRTGNRTTFTSAEMAGLDSESLSAAISNKGTGLALDAGFTIAIDSAINPAASFVIRNIGGTSFKATDGKEKPPSDDEEWILGASITTDFLLFSFTPSIDLRHLNKSDEPLMKKINLGFEFGLPLIDLRAGFSQGYWTAGVGMGLGPLQVDIASYAAELGDKNTTLEDRRYLLQATIELGVDFGNSAGGSDGDTRSRRKRGKLKQRR